jgi:hypothetical protein
MIDHEACTKLVQATADAGAQQLLALTAVNDQLRAENERLRAALNLEVERCQLRRNEINAIRAENERLKKIVDHHEVSDPDCKFCGELRLAAS